MGVTRVFEFQGPSKSLGNVVFISGVVVMVARTHREFPKAVQQLYPSSYRGATLRADSCLLCPSRPRSRSGLDWSL